MAVPGRQRATLYGSVRNSHTAPREALMVKVFSICMAMDLPQISRPPEPSPLAPLPPPPYPPDRERGTPALPKNCSCCSPSSPGEGGREGAGEEGRGGEGPAAAISAPTTPGYAPATDGRRTAAPPPWRGPWARSADLPPVG